MKITTPIGTLNKMIYGELCNQINKNLNSNLAKITDRIRGAVSYYLYNDSTTRVLLNPSSMLVGYLGLDNASARIDDVIKTETANIAITIQEFRYAGGNIRGFLNIAVIKRDLSDILSLPSAQIVSKNGGHNWIQTLCVNGDRIYGVENSFLFKPNGKGIPSSRTGFSLVVNHPGSRLLRTPPESSGVIDNNWLTRCFTDSFYGELQSILMSYI